MNTNPVLSTDSAEQKEMEDTRINILKQRIDVNNGLARPDAMAALAIIERQRIEMKRLPQVQLDYVRTEVEEALRNFADLLKAESHVCLPPAGYPIDESESVVYISDIDDLLKETL